MKCPKCGARIPAGLAICPECGASQSGKERYARCRYCGARVPRGVHVCPQCGRPPTLRGRVSLLLLSILLGILLGVGATVAGRPYLSEVRHKLGTMLLDASGKSHNGDSDVVATATPSP